MSDCEDCKKERKDSLGEKDKEGYASPVVKGFNKDGTNSNSKPNQSTFKPIKSDTLEALLHTLPDNWKIDWWKKQLSIFVPTHILVKREDWEFAIKWMSRPPYFMSPEEDENRKRIEEEY